MRSTGSVDHPYYDEKTGERSHPFLKPEWSPDTLESFFYPGGLVAMKRELVERAVRESGMACVNTGNPSVFSHNKNQISPKEPLPFLYFLCCLILLLFQVHILLAANLLRSWRRHHLHARCGRRGCQRLNRPSRGEKQAAERTELWAEPHRRTGQTGLWTESACGNAYPSPG